ncbi:transcription antitermination factor NusB [Bacillus andreraoultii]|uniref:transcription antitermination factor NusB n=1 Tax=Bacillus andreraoultii TaxID=1499685 RepID=UPI00053ABF82|nr:transcription antitermination factor NusB [Bacillus andreraoultii]
MNRRASREKALQAMFQVDVGKTDKESAYLHVLGNEKDDGFLKELFFGTLNHLNEIDQTIAEYLENWSLERLANVDRNLLRIAVYEMKYMDVPNTVTINEAIEIAKRFGDEKSSKFINGVLSKVLNKIE